MDVPAFLRDSGQLGDIITTYDWAQTSIGQIDNWPNSLRTLLGSILHSAFPMFLFWGDDLLCFYNDAFRPSLGMNGKHPAVGKKGCEVWHDVWDFTGPLLNQVLATGRPVYYEDVLVPFFRNGKTEDIYWTFSYSPAYGDDGAICGVLVTCIETTRAVLDRKNIDEIVVLRTKELTAAHQSLQDAHAGLQTIVNLFTEPLQVLEPVFNDVSIIDFRYKLNNKSYSAYAAVEPEALYGKRVGEVFPAYLQTISFEKLKEVFCSGEPQTWEMRYQGEGLDIYIIMTASKMSNQVVVHFTDITKLKNLQLKLMHKVEELERSNGQLEEFAHAASHDLKEPIRKISFFAQRLESNLHEKMSAEDAASLERIKTASKRMELLIDDLLTYSHVSQKPIEKESIDLNRKLEKVLDDLEVLIQEKKARIIIGALPTVLGYRRQLQQLFQNLICNSLKYSKAGVEPQITISCSEVGGSLIGLPENKKYYRIQIQDNGIGFDQQYADHIFNMFSRLHGKGEYSGTGVGLAIVKRVVENHDGRIEAEGICGEGALFNVYLPVG